MIDFIIIIRRWQGRVACLLKSMHGSLSHLFILTWNYFPDGNVLVSWCSSHPPPPPHCQFLHPCSSPWLPLGCKAYKEIGVLCGISSFLRVCFQICFSPFWRNRLATKKLWFFIPEKEQINRYILYYYAHSSLTPAQFVIRSLLAARKSVVCHRSGWTLLVLLL